MYHNHVKNIKRAKKVIKGLSGATMYQTSSIELIDLLESMVKDAEEGHAKIKQLKAQSMVKIGHI